jgi:hypothetical protein
VCGPRGDQPREPLNCAPLRVPDTGPVAARGLPRQLDVLREEEGTMIWMFLVIVVMGFALVKVRRTRKMRQAAGN